MATIGEQLKAARDAKGVTQLEAADATRILTKIIVALETDDFSVIAAPTYAKGFIRLYAQYLEIDSDPLIEEYNQHYDISPRNLLKKKQSRLKPTKDNSEAPSKPKRDLLAWFKQLEMPAKLAALSNRRTLAIGLGALLLVALIGGILAAVAHRSQSKSSEPAALAIAPVAVLTEEPIPDLYQTAPNQIELQYPPPQS